MINGAEWIIVEKKGVIFTPWQLVAHAVNLKREEHTRGHVSKSSHMSTDKEDLWYDYFVINYAEICNNTVRNFLN